MTIHLLPCSEGSLALNIIAGVTIADYTLKRAIAQTGRS